MVAAGPCFEGHQWVAIHVVCPAAEVVMLGQEPAWQRGRWQRALGQTGLELWGRLCSLLAFGGLLLHGPGSSLVPEELVWVG